MRSILLAATVACALLAGCTGETKTVDVPTPHPLAAVPGVMLDNATGAVSFAYDATGCDEAVLILAVEPAHAQSFLPENFTAADLQSLLATPAPTGKAGVWMNSYTCAAGNTTLHGAELGILVEAPEVHNATVEPADLSIYQLAQGTQSADFAAVLAYAGMPSFAANASRADDAALPAQLSLGTYAVAGDLASYSFRVVAADTEVMSTSANFYHAGNGTLAYMHYELTDIQAQQGTALQCSFAGLAAELAGEAQCLPGSAFTLVVPEQAWTATFHVLPGAHVM